MPFRVLISTPHPDWPLLRQLPGQKASPQDSGHLQMKGSDLQSPHPTLESHRQHGIAHWDNWTFYVDQPVSEVDAWVVFEDLTAPTKVKVPQANTLLITGEPPSMRRYRRSFIQQFAHVITCHQSLAVSSKTLSKSWSPFTTYPEIHLGPQGLPWHIGVDRHKNDFVIRAYSEFKQPAIEKPGLVSVICSNKNITPDHIARQRFVHRLREHFGDHLEVFGRGYRDIGDKWDAIAPYKYHIVLENDSVPHYFSEKLTDCFLAQSYPIYYGCPNIAEYFPSESLTTIDIHQPGQSIATIARILQSDIASQNRPVLAHARDLVLDQYNFFSVIRQFLSKQMLATQSTAQAFYPRRHKWSLQKAKMQRLHRLFHQRAA